jgi:hypothetical protein
MWKFANGTDVFVFFHPSLDIFLQFDIKFNFEFSYKLGHSMPFREIRDDLSTRSMALRSYSEGYLLLSKLRSGLGDTVNGISCFGVWSFVNDGNTIVITAKDKPAQKLVLTNDGFNLLCPVGSLVASHETETFTTTAQGQAVLDKVRASEASEGPPIAPPTPRVRRPST